MAMIGTLISVICGIGALAIGTASAADLPDPAQLRERISARASVMAEYRNMMNNPDPNIAAAAFTELVNSGDAAAKAIAFEEAISSTDNALRFLGLRLQFLDNDVAMIEAGENHDIIFHVKIEDKNTSTGDFTSRYIGDRKISKIIGEQLEISAHYCHAVLRFDGDKYFVGVMTVSERCGQQEEATIPARVRAR